MTNNRHNADMPASSETRHDLSAEIFHSMAETSNSKQKTTHQSREMPVMLVTSHQTENQETREHVPRRNPKHVTGVYRDIRATSTDAEPLPMQAPMHDEPKENTPGESENPQHDFDEDFIEDAYDD